MNLGARRAEPGSSEGFECALREWAAALGAENVVLDEPALRAAETATFKTDRRVPVILRPGSREEAQEVLRIANRHSAPVYPVSSGRNWGYGSKVPSADNCALLDLGRMNAILDYSEDLAYVTVEPGVTQRQLYDFLRSRKSKLWMDATGGSAESSLIGNTVERGFGHTPYGDRFAHVCGLEVLLPTGEAVETGFSRFERSRTGPLYRWGVGPYIDGIFTQSNLGIVTRMSFWLMPAPECFQAYFFRSDSDDDLPALVEALRPLRINGTIQSSIHLVNDYKVLSGLRQYPWDETGGETPLRPAAMPAFRKQLRMGAWNGSGALYGSRDQVRAARKLLRRALSGKTDKLEFLDDRKLRVAERFAGIYRLFTGWDLSRALELVRPVYGLMKGTPTNHPLNSTYWRKRTPIPEHMDPDRDGCGLIWCAPIAPASGDAAHELTQLASSILLAHGFEPAISLTMINGRSLACVISIAYDRDVSGEDDRANACYDELLARLAERGFYSYRLTVRSMHALGEGGGYNALVRTLKSALDPKGVLAPLRYEPGQPR